MSRGDILLLHGAFVGGWVFERLRGHLSHRGWRTHAPDLPFHGPDHAARDANGQPPDPRLAELGLRDYRRAMKAEIAKLNGKPVLIGHSLGGLLAQQLAARELCRAAILLAPVAPWGVLPHSWQEIASGFALMWKGGTFWNKALPPDRQLALDYAMAHLPPSLQRDALNRLVPESGRALFESLMWWLDWQAASHVKFHDLKCPLLILVGEDDRVTPPSSCRAIARHYPGRAVYRELPGMGHFLFGESNEALLFQECADWLETLP
ncbi:alpha/beta hydrolase [Ferrovibrio sp.]|uniref:alpha/beta hydrolase n=1 Tax=Ferrovibrio sp. TaxID=1917215 RepID=UPI0035B123A0